MHVDTCPTCQRDHSRADDLRLTPDPHGDEHERMAAEEMRDSEVYSE